MSKSIDGIGYDLRSFPIDQKYIVTEDTTEENAVGSMMPQVPLSGPVIKKQGVSEEDSETLQDTKDIPDGDGEQNGTVNESSEEVSTEGYTGELRKNYKKTNITGRSGDLYTESTLGDKTKSMILNSRLDILKTHLSSLKSDMKKPGMGILKSRFERQIKDTEKKISKIEKKLKAIHDRNPKNVRDKKEDIKSWLNEPIDEVPLDIEGYNWAPIIKKFDTFEKFKHYCNTTKGSYPVTTLISNSDIDDPDEKPIVEFLKSNSKNLVVLSDFNSDVTIYDKKTGNVYFYYHEETPPIDINQKQQLSALYNKAHQKLMNDPDFKEVCIGEKSFATKEIASALAESCVEAKICADKYKDTPIYPKYLHDFTEAVAEYENFIKDHGLFQEADDEEPEESDTPDDASETDGDNGDEVPPQQKVRPMDTPAEDDTEGSEETPEGEEAPEGEEPAEGEEEEDPSDPDVDKNDYKNSIRAKSLKKSLENAKNRMEKATDPTLKKRYKAEYEKLKEDEKSYNSRSKKDQKDEANASKNMNESVDVQMDDSIYQRILKLIEPSLPHQWKRVQFRADYTKGSYSMKYIVTTHNNKKIECNNLSGMTNQKLVRTYLKINKILEPERKKLVGKHKWNILTMTVESSGKVKTNFSYENIDENYVKKLTEWTDDNMKEDTEMGYIDDMSELFNESTLFTEAADIASDMKPIIEALNNKGYKTKYSSPGYEKSRSKDDAKRDGVKNGKLYSTARIMFEGDYNFPPAPEGWEWRQVDKNDYLDVKEKTFNDESGESADAQFAEWKKEYMSSLRAWVKELPKAGTKRGDSSANPDKDDEKVEESGSVMESFDNLFDDIFGTDLYPFCHIDDNEYTTEEGALVVGGLIALIALPYGIAAYYEHKKKEKKKRVLLPLDEQPFSKQLKKHMPKKIVYRNGAKEKLEKIIDAVIKISPEVKSYYEKIQMLKTYEDYVSEKPSLNAQLKSIHSKINTVKKSMPKLDGNNIIKNDFSIIDLIRKIDNIPNKTKYFNPETYGKSLIKSVEGDDKKFQEVLNFLHKGIEDLPYELDILDIWETTKVQMK